MTYIKLGAGAVVLAAFASAAWYFNWSQEEMVALREDKVKLELAVEQSEAALVAMRESMMQAVEQFNKTNQSFQRARRDNVVLRDKLGRHELGALAEAKPGLVENVINKASDNAARCFEILTGSDLTESERAATKKSEINASCPEVANPNYVREE